MNYRQISLSALAVQSKNENGEDTYSPAKGTAAGSIKSFATLRNTHYKTLNFSFKQERAFELIAEDIDGFRVVELRGTCALYIDEPVPEKRIPITRRFDYPVTIKKLYLSNTVRDGNITILFDRIVEVG